MEFEVNGTKFKWWNEFQEEQEKREQKISKADYFKIETKNYCAGQTLS
jgi:hypothetical protein